MFNILLVFIHYYNYGFFGAKLRRIRQKHIARNRAFDEMEVASDESAAKRDKRKNAPGPRGKDSASEGEKILHPRGKRFYYRVLFMFHDVKYTSLDAKHTSLDAKYKICLGAGTFSPKGKEKS